MMSLDGSGSDIAHKCERRTSGRGAAAYDPTSSTPAFSFAAGSEGQQGGGECA